MSQRESKMLLLKDVLDHLRKNHQQLEWAETPDMIGLLTENMLRDLRSCQTICEELNRKARVRQAA